MNRLSSQDMGLRDMYNYHMYKTFQKRKVDFSVVDIWKPQDMRQEKIYILNKILEKAKGHDGRVIEVHDTKLPLLFLTAGWEKVIKKNGEILYQPNKKQALDRARSRVDDFKKHGLIEGEDNYIAITFTGKEILEQIVDVDDLLIEKMRNFISDMDKYIRTSNQINLEINDLVKESYNSIQQNTSKGKVLSSTVSNLANAITILTEIPETVNIVAKGLSLLRELVHII